MRVYTDRPPATARKARQAWAELSKLGTVARMWHTFLSYPVWVAEMQDGSHEEVESLALRGWPCGHKRK